MLNVYVAPACVCGVKTVRPAERRLERLRLRLRFRLNDFLLMRVGSTHLHVFTHLQSCTIINRGMRMGSPAPHHMTGLEDGTCTHT